MKYLSLVLLAFLLSCEEDMRFISADRNEEFTLSVGQTAIIHLTSPDGATESDISISLSAIDESRCPSSVQCFRAGEVFVTVDITGTQEILQRFEMCLGDCLDRNMGFIQMDTVDFVQDNFELQLVLQEVFPYPELPSEDIDQFARFILN